MDVGIVGAGVIGRKVAKELDHGKVPGVRVTSLSSRDMAKAETFAATLASAPKVTSLEDMPSMCDLIIEAAGAHVVDAVVRTAIQADTAVMVLSCGALLERDDLFELARQNNTRIHIPSGAIAGLDGLLAAAMGDIEKVTLITRKPPQGLHGAPGVIQAGVDLDAITAPTQIFEGSVIDGFPLFPANVNVAAAISMAGIGPHKTLLQVVADPTVVRNTHDVVVEGDFGLLQIHIENIPSDGGPRTGRLTALSILAYLKQMTSPAQLGI